MSDVENPPLGPHVIPPPPTDKPVPEKKSAEIFVFSLDKRKPKLDARAPESDLETATRKAAERKLKEEEDRKKHNAAITNGLRKK